MTRYLYLTLYGCIKYIPTPLGDIIRYLFLKLFLKELKTYWIHEGVSIHHPHQVKIGRGTALNEFVFINGYGGVTLGEGIAIGHNTAFISMEHDLQTPDGLFHDGNLQPKPIVVGDGVYFGTGVKVLGGVTIGKGAIIGAGAVVTQDIPDFAVAVGVPAKVIRVRKPIST